jgi:hypothetical protein
MTTPIPHPPQPTAPAKAPVTPPLLDAIVAAETPDHFIGPAQSCFRLIGRAVLVLLAGTVAVEAAAGVARVGRLTPELNPADPMLWATAALAVVGLGLDLGAVSMLGSIQVRYTFEHAHLHKGHFYALKLARQREAIAALQSMAVSDAVPAVSALIELRRETGFLDRTLAIETLMLRRRWRDLTWFPRAGLALVLAGLVALTLMTGALDQRGLIAPSAIAGAGLVLWFIVERWAAERVARVREVLQTSPPELSREFDPSPHLQATVERLLVRINHHFDRLKGVQTPVFQPQPDTVEEEAA